MMATDPSQNESDQFVVLEEKNKIGESDDYFEVCEPGAVSSENVNMENRHVSDDIEGWSVVSTPSNKLSLSKDDLLKSQELETEEEKNLKRVYSWHSIENPMLDVMSIGSSSGFQEDSNPNSSGSQSQKPDKKDSAAKAPKPAVFSWAEIAKIQPTFQRKARRPDQPGAPPQPLQIHRPVVHSSEPKPNQNKKSNRNSRRKKAKRAQPLGVIHEADAGTTKSDLGRNPRRAGKRGSRVKFANGRRGSRRNSRRKG